MSNLRNSLKYRALLLAVIMLIAISAGAYGKAQLPYNQYSNLSVTELYRKAEDYSRRQMPDSALACFAMCGLKYKPSLDKEELALTVNAMRKEAQFYFYYYYEYETACDRLAQAARLCKTHKLNNILPQILMEQGGVYYTYATQNNDTSLFNHAIRLYHDAFAEGAKIGDVNVMANTFANLAPYYQDRNDLMSLKKEMDIFGRKVAGNPDSRFLYSIILYKGMQQLLNNNQAEARKIFLSADFSRLQPRHQFKLIVSAVRSYLSEDKLDSAIVLEHQLLNLCEKNDMKDGRAIVLRDLSTLYNAVGDSVKGQKYALLGLQSKDTLINVNHLDKAANMAFLEEMHKLHDEAERSDRQTKYLIIVIVSLVLILIVSYIVWLRKNKRNREAMAKASATLDALQKQYAENMKASEAVSESQEGEAEPAKYKSSNMDDYTCEVLTERIKRLFSQDNDAIYVQGFSIDDAAKAVKSNSKYVSQIINQTFGCNFATLLSTVRAREAARRIADNGHYGQLTFEAIGTSVGFGSRAAFNAAFKRLTGKTPREYRNSLCDNTEQM